MIDLSKVNEKQKEAIVTTEGPVLVVAGAGTGKTRVLTTRIAYLIDEIGCAPVKILALTFTNKAANEMKERIYKLLDQISVPWIGTFHSICLRILREDMRYLNRESSFAVIDNDDQISMIKDIYKNNDIFQKNITPKKMLAIIDFLKNNEIEYEQIDDVKIFSSLQVIDIVDLKVIKFLFKTYQERMVRQNLLDFNDLLLLTKKILKNFPECKEKWQNKFDYILTDEFQDTNKIQFDIIKYLVKPGLNNIFVVGDPDQTIYTWRGAYADIMDEFKKLYPNMKVIVLENNYRSTKSILKGANNLILNNSGRIKKDLETENMVGNKISYYQAADQDDESRFIANSIKTAVESKTYQYKENVILYRANHLSRNIEQALINKNIPYFIFGGFKFYQRKEIKDILAYLKLMINDDELSFKRIADVPKRKISELTIEKISKYASVNKISFWEAIKKVNSIDSISPATANACFSFYKLILNLRELTKDLSTLSALKLIIEKINYFDYLKTLDFELRAENVEELKNSIAQYEKRSTEPSIANYLQEISLYTDADDEKNKTRDAVSLMTVHLAKGLEFRNVYIMGLNENIFPSFKCMRSKDEMYEERRVAYVAMTRAKENLFLTCSNGYSYITNSVLSPSRFIEEIGDENLDVIMPDLKVISDKSLGWFDSSKTDYSDNYNSTKVEYNVGDTVIHIVFGAGLVIAVRADYLEIAFKNPHGVKSILKTHKSLKRMVSNG